MLISDEYRAQQKTLHENPEYGVASVHFAPMVSKFINQLQIDEALDYGCGKGRLAEALSPDRNLKLMQYDPAVEEFSGDPEPMELVVCLDVLEHIEPDLLDNVLDDIKRLANRYVFLTIHTGPAVKTLPDGRNAHLTQQDYEWWLPKLWDRWQMITYSNSPNGFVFVGAFKPKIELV